MNISDGVTMTGSIPRRSLLRRDPEVNWRNEIEAIRWRYPSMSTIAWILNVPRSTLMGWWEGSVPNYEDGRALLKLAEQCRR